MFVDWLGQLSSGPIPLIGDIRANRAMAPPITGLKVSEARCRRGGKLPYRTSISLCSSAGMVS